VRPRAVRCSKRGANALDNALVAPSPRAYLRVIDNHE
jgi:hypothetical protein